MTSSACGLTTLDFSNKLRAMSISLDSLERRIDELLAVCHSLRSENESLRGKLVGLEGEKQKLTLKIDTAAERLEGLLTKLPTE